MEIQNPPNTRHFNIISYKLWSDSCNLRPAWNSLSAAT